MEEMSHIYATLKYQYNIKYQLPLLVIFKKYGEDEKITSEIE